MGSLQSWLHRHEAGWRPDIARREEAREREQPIAASEYEYRCAEYEYEYEYDGKRSAAMLGFYFVLSPLLRTVLVLVLAAPPIPR